MNVLHGTECNYGEIFPVLCPCDLEQILTLQPGVSPTHSAMLWSVCWWCCLVCRDCKAGSGCEGVPICTHPCRNGCFTCSQHLSHCAVIASVCVPGTWREQWRHLCNRRVVRGDVSDLLLPPAGVCIRRPEGWGAIPALCTPCSCAQLLCSEETP